MTDIHIRAVVDRFIHSADSLFDSPDCQSHKHCVIHLKKLLDEANGPKIPRVIITGKAILEAMDFAPLQGMPCCSAHTLFFNGIAGPLHGNIGSSTTTSVTDKGKEFWTCCCGDATKEINGTCKNDNLLQLMPDCNDTCDFVKHMASSASDQKQEKITFSRWKETHKKEATSS